MGAVASFAAPIAGALIGSDASQSAADTQAQATQQASQIQSQMLDKQLAQQMAMFNQQQANLAPWRQTGQLALSDLAKFMGVGDQTGVGGAGTAPGISQFQYDPAKDPGYQFRLNQGLGAITNQASAIGGVNSGATLKSLSDYAQGQAAQSYQQEFNNWNTMMNNIFNRLSGVSGTGANTAAGIAGMGMNTSGNIAQQGIGTAADIASNLGAASQVQSLAQLQQGKNLMSLFSDPSWLKSMGNMGSSVGGTDWTGVSGMSSPADYGSLGSGFYGV